MSPEWRDWLLDRGSLTKRLIDASDDQLTVQVLSQRTEMARPSEILALSLLPRQRALIREVLLLAKGEPWVYARSVIPLTTLTGRLRALRHLNDRPLGTLLFNDPSMTRQPIEVATISPDTPGLPVALNSNQTNLWGRRSVFCLDTKPLLVAEIFLPAFQPYNQRLA